MFERSWTFQEQRTRGNDRDIESCVERLLEIRARRLQEQPFRGLADHLPPVSPRVEHACRRYARRCSKKRSKRVFINASAELFSRLFELGVEAGALDNALSRARLYATHLSAAARRRGPAELKKRRDPCGESVQELDESCLACFFDLAVELRRLTRENANNAWFAYFEPRGGQARWKEASAPLGVSENYRLAHLVLETWRKYFGLRKPPQGLVNQLYSQSEPEFRKSLKAEINKSAATLKKTILPRGRWHRVSRNDAISWFSEEGSQIDWERFDFLESLNPNERYRGEHLSSARYIAFEFDDVVVAESNQTGNALYYVAKSEVSWESILTLTKREALNGGAKRIIHHSDGKWKKKLTRLVKSGRRN